MNSRLSGALVRQLEERVRERPLVVWLDRDGVYEGFVERLEQAHGVGRFAIPVVAFRGELSRDAAGTGALREPRRSPAIAAPPAGAERRQRAQDALPGIYVAGRRFERALETLVREAAAGMVPPEEVERFVATGPVGFEAAEAWLEHEANRDRRGLASVLATLEPKWVFDELTERGGNLRARLEAEPDPGDLQDYFHLHTGFSEEFAHLVAGTERPGNLRSLTDALASWVLCAEYVENLSRPPVLAELLPLKKLSKPLRETSIALARRLREKHAAAYRTQALVTEGQLREELAAGRPEELGRVDTFSGQDTRLLQAAFGALQEGRWSEARDWAEQRLEGNSFWLESEPARRHEWELVLGAATFGQALGQAGRPLAQARTLDEALTAYTGSAMGARRDGAQAVDRAHRQFEELRRRKLVTQLPHATDLWEAASRLRSLYRAWVDQMARDFSTLCEEHGFLPPPSLQQRTLFEQVVHPRLAQDATRCALFMVDALRYEMAAQLACSLDGPGVAVHLGARLAELPTITSVGMNALAPAARDGRLTVVSSPGKGGARTFGGLRCGEFTVRDPSSRVRAMAERSLETLPGQRKKPPDLELAELVDLETETLRRKTAGNALVVVHSREIDESGEASLGLFTFDTWLGQLRAAVQKLRSVGVTSFVITSDHGFLLQDETTHPVVYDAGRERDRRYAVLDAAVMEPDLTGTSLSALGYDGVDGYLRLPRDTRVFNASGRSSSTFVHGGNTLQERAIPVLVVESRRTQISRLTRYQVLAEPCLPVLDLHRIRVKLELSPGAHGVLQFAAGRGVPLSLRVPDRTAQVHIRDVTRAELTNQRVLVQPGADWAEIMFSLVGPSQERAQVEVYHADAEEDVTPCRLDAYFDVVTGAAGTEAASATPPPDRPWHANIEDEGHRRVLLHLDQYGTVSEENALELLGGARAERRFGMRLQTYRELLPFAVTVEMTSSGKRYVKGRTAR